MPRDRDVRRLKRNVYSSIKIVLEMFLANRPLMRAQQPAFDQGGNAMNSGHADVDRVDNGDNLDLLSMAQPSLHSERIQNPEANGNDNITTTCRLISEPFQKLLVGLRIILPRDWIYSCTHRVAHYMS